MALEVTYTVTAKKTGTITFKFNLNSDLIEFKYVGDPFNAKQREWFYKRMPISEDLMKHWYAIKEFTVTKGDLDLSFDNFWNTYNKKEKKTVATALWKKLSQDDKFNAIVFVKRFDSHKRKEGTAKPLPDTYLRQKRWLDEL